MSAADRSLQRAVRGSRRGYTGMRVAGGVITAVLVGGAAVSSIPTMLRQEETMALDLPQDLTGIVVRAPRGDVEVRELTDGGTGQVEAELEWALSRPDLGPLTGSDDGTIVVTAPCEGVNFGTCAASFAITVPPGTDVEVIGGFGDVDVDSTGTVEASATGGDLTVSGEPSRVALTSTLGNVTVERLGAPPELVRVDSTLGDVDVTLPAAVSYVVSTATELGDTQVTVDRASDSPYVVDVETTLGSIEVTTPTSTGTSVDTDPGSGDGGDSGR